MQGRSAQQLLDAIQRRVQLDELDPRAYAAQLEADLTSPITSVADLEARDAVVRGALAALDAFAKKAMKIRLEHALVDDTSIVGTFRTYLSSTVLDHRDALDQLRDRVAATVGRVDPRRAHDLADAVLESARTVHRQHAELRAEVLQLGGELAAAALPVAQREGWTPARRDLERVVEQPARIAQAPMAARIAALPELEETPVEPPSREELIELD